MSKSDTFICRAREDGNLEFTDYNRARLKQWCKENAGSYLKIAPQRVESTKQRRFFEGAVVPLVAYFQEGMDYRSTDDCHKVREWLKLEFNGEVVVINGKTSKVAKSTKGELADFLERVIAWMDENGYPTNLLNPDDYKYWADALYGFGTNDTYIDYLIEKGSLKPLHNITNNV